MSNSSLDVDIKPENYYSDKIVTVKFRTDTNETLTQAFDLKTNIGALRSHLHQLLNVDANKIVIEHQESTLQDSQTLEELGATSLGTFELNLRGDGIQLPKSTYYLPVVDVITVDVKQRRLVVEIERCSVDKPWLGGYRDRNSGKVYYHAASQTDFKPKMYSDVVQEDRQSQTCENKGIGRSSHNTWTQTNTGADALQVQHSGRLVRAKRYQSYQAWLQEDYVLASVLRIQRAYRNMVAHRKRRSAAEDQQRTSSIRAQPEEQSSTVAATPLESKQQHFYALYTMIGKWWKRERERIKKIEVEGQRKAAQVNLLMKEIKFLLQMEKERSELKYEMTKHDDMTFLNRTSKPKMFKNKSGKLLTVDTVGNQKARALKDLYTGLQQTCGGAETDRAAVLARLRAVVSESCYKYKRDFLAAIAMELDLANMGAGASSVRSVRARVDQMFRHFIRQPEVNPEADAYYRPTERRVLNVYTCIRCKRNLAAADFSLESRVNRTNVCAGCEWTEQVGHKRIDMAPYRRLLNAVRRDEMQLAAYQSECFLMQPTEVYRLVSVVWNEKSAVGDCGGGATVSGAQLNGLRLVRWRRHEPWSPWNCVLLTRAEAAVHCQLDGDPADCYDERFVSRVANRHMMARLLFGNLVRAVRNRDVGHGAKVKPLPKNWKIVADRFNIKTCT